MEWQSPMQANERCTAQETIFEEVSSLWEPAS